VRFPQTHRHCSASTVDSSFYAFRPRRVEGSERSDDKNNAHVIEEVEKLYVTEEVERSAEEVNADVVETIEDAHEVIFCDVYVMAL